MDFPLKRDCFVTSITLAALAKLGPSILDMDPLLVRDACETVFGLGKMPQRMFDKLNCGLMLVGTTAYTDTIEGFLSGTACMNNQVYDSYTAPFCDLTQCCWGVWEYINLNGDIDRNLQPTETFCPEIIKYIQEAAWLNGIVKFPTWMQFAEKPKGEMPDMGNDIMLFEQFMQRQDDYVADIKAKVDERQEKLLDELRALKAAGIIAKNT